MSKSPNFSDNVHLNGSLVLQCRPCAVDVCYFGHKQTNKPTNHKSERQKIRLAEEYGRMHDTFGVG